MNSSLDLNLLLISQKRESNNSKIMDLSVVAPPRRTARGRESDSLIIYLSLTGNSPLTTEAHTQLFDQLAQKFYKTTGSLTAALRTVAETVNLFLLDRNLRSTSAGRQGIGQLLLAAFRADTLYLAECGAVQAFTVTPTQTQPLYDLETTGRGLGISRALPVRFLQIKPAVDEYLVLSTIPSAGWSETILSHPGKQGLEGLRQILTEGASIESSAVIIQPQAGTGKLKVLQPGAVAAVVASPLAVELQSKDVSSPGLPVQEAVEAPEQAHQLDVPPLSAPAPEPLITDSQDNGQGIPANDSAPSLPATSEASIKKERQAQPVPPTGQVISQSPQGLSAGKSLPEAIAKQPINPAIPSIKQSKPATPPQKEQPASQSRPWTKQLTAFRVTLVAIGTTILRATRRALGFIGAVLLRLLKNLLPDADVFRLPPSTMLFIAIAIPLILAVLGGMTYLQRGQAQQFQTYYLKAVDKANYASNLTNPVEQRLAWQTTLGELDKAEQYGITSQSQALRSKVMAGLDALNSVKRLDYKQAIVNGLDTNINVTRMIATDTDLYLLDGKQGTAIHAILTGNGYEIDPGFVCGPTTGPINVGPLIDIAALPPGAYENASLLGMDSNSNLLYCIVGSQPYSASLAPPNTEMGQPIGMTIDQGDLYVLDPKVNAVWIYRNMDVTQPPRLFFGDTVPPMQDVIDLAVYNDDLFMLHADGHSTKCTYSAMSQSPTRCTDPFPYSDNRPGRSHGPVVEDAVFTQIYYATFPERAIYYLDPQNQAIYYFSVLLTLQWQYQPKDPLTQGNATAFTISPNRIAFLAIANNVYYAAMP